MKANVNQIYGSPDVLEFKEVEKPVLRDGEVLKNVRAASVNAYDWHMPKADGFMVRFMGGGVLKPKDRIPGADMAGRVEAVGSSVTQFRPMMSMIGKRKMRNFVAQPNQKDLVFIKELLETGKVVPVIDRRYPLNEVPDAIRYIEEGHARGKVVIIV